MSIVQGSGMKVSNTNIICGEREREREREREKEREKYDLQSF